MSKFRLKLRDKKNCLNCGAYVEDRFCPHCGQENIVNRPSFHYLFTAFFRALLNYESGFWQTFRALVVPGRLIKAYLEGKRKSFVPPIKLYFFVSLITFLLPSILIGPETVDTHKTKASHETEVREAIYPLSENKKQTYHAFSIVDSIPNLLPESKKLDSLEQVYFKEAKKIPYKIDDVAKSLKRKKDDQSSARADYSVFGLRNQKYYQAAKTIAEFDSIDKELSSDKRLSWIVKPVFRKSVELTDRGIIADDQFEKQFSDAFKNNFSRVLIFYMPIFAFILFLFHSSKKWKYYDHGIFTLYYFALLLILTSLVMIFKWIIFLPIAFYPGFLWWARVIGLAFGILCFLYSLWYFFRAHRRIYGDSKLKSFFKACGIFLLSTMFFVFMLLGYTFTTFLNI